MNTIALAAAPWSGDRNDHHAQWRAVLDGEANLFWELWSPAIDPSCVLTADGKRPVQRAVDMIVEFFGPTWLADAWRG